GGLSPTTAAHVAEAFARDETGHLDCILEGGACEVGVESTVVGWDNGEPVLLRAGGISFEALAVVLGRRPGRPVMTESSPHGPVASPGALPWHYAPRTPLSLLPDADGKTGVIGEKEGVAGRAGLLWFGPDAPRAGYARVENLS